MITEKFAQRRRLLKLTTGLPLLITLSGCYTLSKRDIFEVSFDEIRAADLVELSDVDHTFQKLPLRAGGRPVTAYWDRGRTSRGVLIFFNGNGYGAETAARRILIPSRALGLDLVVFNYLDHGNEAPSMAQMREISRALCETAAKLPVPAARHIYVGGHSLGATFVLDVASNESLAGAFLAAPLTTGVEMLRHQLPVTRLAHLKPDEDYRQLDNLTLAERVRTRILVVGSDADAALPSQFTHAVYAALPAGIIKREMILHGVAHSGYLADDGFWKGVSDFLGLPIEGKLEGFIGRGQAKPG